MPFDTAFQIDDNTRKGFCIIFQEFEHGMEFDFASKRFVESRHA